MGSAAEDPALWLPIARQRAAIFPGFLIGTHARLLRCTGSGPGWHGTLGKTLVASAIIFEIVSALYINLFVGILPWAAYTVFLVLSWKLVRHIVLRSSSPCTSAGSSLCTRHSDPRLLHNSPSIRSGNRSCSRGAPTVETYQTQMTAPTRRAARRRAQHSSSIS